MTFHIRAFNTLHEENHKNQNSSLYNTISSKYLKIINNSYTLLSKVLLLTIYLLPFKDIGTTPWTGECKKLKLFLESSYFVITLHKYVETHFSLFYQRYYF